MSPQLELAKKAKSKFLDVQIVQEIDGGRCLFFGMATSFQQAALGAEGVGKDVMLLIGNGFVPGHAETMLDLLRETEALHHWFKESYE